MFVESFDEHMPVQQAVVIGFVNQALRNPAKPKDGVEIPAGARVRVCMGSANLDETVFADPLTFDLERKDLHLGVELRSGGSTDRGRAGHLGFGLGKHFCIGYQLARTEAKIGSQQLLRRCADLRIAPGAEPSPTIQGNAFQAVESLPLTFIPLR